MKLTLISARAEMHVAPAIKIDDRSDVEALVCALLAAPPVRETRTLDLVGPTTDGGLLQLGAWTVDATRPTTAAFFRELADQDVLVRLGISAVRLIGSNTASARGAIEALSRILDAEIYGAVGPIHAGQFDAHGFTADDVLVRSADLRREVPVCTPTGVPLSRLFDLDALPEGTGAEIDPARVRSVLELVVRDAGVQMTGLLAVPSHRVTLLGRRIDVLLDASWVRTDDDVLYPVRDPAALRALLA